MRHRTLAAREVGDDRHDEFGLDRAEERRSRLDASAGHLRGVTHRLGDHARVSERQDGVGEDPVRGTLDGDDVRQPDDAGLCGGIER